MNHKGKILMILIKSILSKRLKIKLRFTASKLSMFTVYFQLLFHAHGQSSYGSVLHERKSGGKYQMGILRMRQWTCHGKPILGDWKHSHHIWTPALVRQGNLKTKRRVKHDVYWTKCMVNSISTEDIYNTLKYWLFHTPCWSLVAPFYWYSFIIWFMCVVAYKSRPNNT